ncbi:hypothetical protein MKZ38_000796 [Zalerion maritima]|uniref:Uncharacterized protein n=1 Tax=Zalerion maritima TaxID=339359 RepID=A0AAD5WSB8_9PEZI|nr:hypothetical protein MKZ38_000796 [Zalerion maritima]
MPGGVCAVLDYDVDLMAEYVSEMATRLSSHQGQGPVAPTFRKFVQQILTSTRLPRTTILLGMNYLAKRINMLKAAGNEQFAGDGQIWRMLTIALLLGSKFLDDNTFQNRSWSEVSGLPVSELNTLENQWLAAIGWNLYVNLDHSKDYNAWLKSFEDWLKDRREKHHAHRERLQALSPIDTEVRTRTNHVQGWSQSQSDYDRAARLKRNEYTTQQTYRPRDLWQTTQYQPQQNPWHHPLTPPDSGYGTPEYPNSATSSAAARYNDWFAQAAATSNIPTSYQNTSTHSSYQPSRTANAYSSYYANSQQYGHQYYEHGVLDCSCANCIPNKQQPYFMSHHGYGQPVAG